MVRSSRTGTLSFDPEIEKTTRQLRQQTKRAKQWSSSSLLFETDTVPDLVESSSDSEEQVIARRKFLIRRAHVLTNKYFCDF